MKASSASRSACAAGNASGASMTESRPDQFFQEIATRLEAKQPFALATVVHTSGSTPQKAGARAIFLPDGRVLGTLGGGCMEAEARRGALALVVAAPSPADVGRTLLVPEEGPLVGALADAALAEEVASAARQLLEEGGEAPRRLTVAEGRATLFMEPILPRPVLLIMGAGHIGTALTHYGARIGFEVVVVDDRASFANRERLPDADQVIVDSGVEVARRWPKRAAT